MKKLYLILLSVLTISFAIPASAQITTTVLSGKVVDSKGVTMPGVTIQAVNTSTGTRYGAQTNADGRYTIANVNPGGPYTITVTFIGYKKEERPDLTFNLGGMTFNFMLSEEATALKEVTVRSTAGPTKTGAGTRIGQNAIKTLPSINRNFADLTRTTPQSNNNSFQGTNYRYNNVTLDGAINNDAIGFSPSLGGQNNSSGQVGSSTRTNPVPMDAVQDIQVYVAPFDIKIGNVLGGSINAVTRSGTNDVTGSLYTYGRNASLTGHNNASAAAGGDGAKEPSDFHDYQVGGRLGFPIIKNKLFFFTNEEINRRQDPVISAAGTAGSAKILSLQDAQNLAAAFKSYSGLDPGTYGNTTIFSNSNKFFNRLDWNINDKNQLTIRNNTISSQATNLERDQTNFRFSGIDYTSHNNSSSTVAELKSRISNNASNSLLVGYSNVHDYRDPNSNPALPQIEINGNTPGTTIFMGTDREAAIFDMHQKTTELTDNFTWTKGKHTFTFGTHNEFYNITYNFVNAWNGRIAYSSIANFLANIPSRTRANFNYTDNTRDYILANPSAQFKVDLLSFYGQDEMQLTDNFKLTAGIRFDYAGVPDKQPLSSKTTGAPVDPNYGNTFTYTLPKNIQNKYLNNVEINPRVSFNYDVNGDQSVILRGGSGMFTGRVPFAWFGYAFYNNGVTYGAYDVKPTTAAPIKPGTNPVQAPANGGLGFVNQQGFNTTPNGATQVDMIDNNFKMPQVWRSSLAMDVTTPDQWKFTVEGIYTKTIHDLKFQQVNTTDQVTYYPYDTQHQQPIFVNTKINPLYTNAYLLSNTSLGYRYSATAQIAKLFTLSPLSNINATVAYTYGHSKDVTNGIRNSMESNWQLNQALNPNNPGLANSNFDIRNRIVSTFNFMTNWDADKKYTANFTLFFSAQSGNPYTYGFYPNAIDGTGQQVSLAYIPKVGETAKFFQDIAGGQTAAQQAAAFDAFIDANKYLKSRRGQFTERNAAFTPWNNNLDFRFAQDFKFGAKHKQVITFTYDIVNLTNLLNKKWGQYYFSPNTYNSTSSIGLTPKTTPSFANAATTNPTYTFTNPGLPYSVDYFASRWQMQFGARYSF
ncbi:TonB-dependent receptor [Mucilaginibacter jinjuensis]|uniref:Carboxypeptidase regulatory-like domain-containing protein n=1 Tax=Mucilaginibacter jinjuensis TaxID=1176721 RepID=A0ABY7TB86_9SPHI|nr:carboxypeptidase regulatory-like domain-containing protein [Mucilaginibacter jinjuensis]WCT13601.1 carboxypeptidase regulatory-like domain-containing protein [Mucilaginibacter jinjuensis]